VQTYTHPLWMLIVGAAYGMTRESAFTTIALCLACSAGLVWVIATELQPVQACVALALMVSSRAFVDYSTSGLENPLAHLLLASFWLLFVRDTTPPRSPRRLLTLALLASLVGLTRLDLLVLVLPPLLFDAWHLPWRAAARALIVFALPLAAWHLFSLIYYGFLFPNTAYAKLATGVPATTMALQGLRYLRASWPLDRVTPAVLAASIVAACWQWRRPEGRRAFVCGVGVIGYVVYVVRVGGDYMNGRLLAAPFLGAVLILATAPWVTRRFAAPALAAAALIIAIMTPSSPLRPWQSMATAYSDGYGDGVVDERALNYDNVGLIPMLRGSSPSRHPLAQFAGHYSYMPQVLHVFLSQTVGILGFYAGPGLHIVDVMGLGDPLLARMPTLPGYRAGHYERKPPDWYIAFLKRCADRLNAAPTSERSCLPFASELNDADDRVLVPRYRDLLLVTQGPLFDGQRLRTIVRLNLLAVR
jgi:arabinofuranosyltransferase